jgi:hypothetical protein
MDILDLLRGSLGTQPDGEPPASEAMAYSPPTEAPLPRPQAPTLNDTPPDSGGSIMSGLGLTRDNLPMLARALAGGLSKVKSGTTAGESIAQALGGSLSGGNTYEDADRKQRLAEETQRALQDYRNRSLDETSKYHEGTLGVSRQNANSTEAWRADQANRGKWQLQNVATKDADGNPTVKSIWVDSSTGDTKPFEEGIATGKPGGASREGQTERLANRLIEEAKKEGKTLSLPEAIAITKRAPNGSTDDLRRERLALEAAKGDPDYNANTDKVIEKYRKKYGLNPAPVATPPAAPSGPTFVDRIRGIFGSETAPATPPAPQRPDLMTPGDGGKPLDIPVPKRPSSVPSGSAYSPSRRQWRDATGTLYDETGAPIE